MNDPKFIASSAYLSSTRGQFGFKFGKASRLRGLFAFVLAFAWATSQASAHSAPASLSLPTGWSLSDIIGPNSMGYAYDANGNRTQAFYSTITPAGTATLQRSVQTTSGTNRISGYSQAFKPAGSTTSQNSTVSYLLDASGALTKKGDNHLHQTAQGRIAKVSLSAHAKRSSVLRPAFVESLPNR